MARKLVLSLDGEVSELPFTRLAARSPFGSRDKLVTDDAGELSQRGRISADGSTVIPPGGLTQVYRDQAGNHISRSELVTIDEYGDVLDTLPSTLGIEHELYGPVPAARLLDHVTTSVYRIDDADLGPELAAALERGDIFEAEFRYNPSTSTKALFLLRGDEGTVALISEPLAMRFVDRDEDPETNTVDDDEEDDDDDFDFSF
ncbi:MAG: hypothetical protein PF961_01745 [Planctomycetota bacterium]|jgi:hypothetical protein|nr:hypothetical protein [Planctomycetota bacterium]